MIVDKGIWVDLQLRRFFFLFMAVLGFLSCQLKSKTELYLERDLDVLSNKKRVDFVVTPDLTINEVAVIRDRKKNEKTLVLKVLSPWGQKEFAKYTVVVEARIRDRANKERTEIWEFPANLVVVDDRKYLTNHIRIKENKVRRLKMNIYQRVGNQKKINGNTLILSNLHTNND